MKTPRKNGQIEKKTLHCLVDADAFDFMKMHVLKSGTSIASFINTYLQSVYRKAKKNNENDLK